MDDGFDLPRPGPALPDDSGLDLRERDAADSPPRNGSDAEEISPVDRYSLFEQTRRGIRIGRLGIVLEPRTLYEVVESVNITPLPGVRSLFKGFVTHRSNVVPVYDLAELIDSGRPAWERKRLLILNSGREAVGIVLFELPHQIRVDFGIGPEKLEDIPDIFRRHTREAYRTQGVLWLALDYEHFFSELSTLCVQVEDFDADAAESLTPVSEY